MAWLGCPANTFSGMHTPAKDDANYCIRCGASRAAQVRRVAAPTLIKPGTDKWKIVQHLRAVRRQALQPQDAWVRSNELHGVTVTVFGVTYFIGDEGKRRCRELAEEGVIESIQRGPFVYYRALPEA